LVLFNICFKDNIEVTHVNIENHFKIMKMDFMVLIHWTILTTIVRL